ncbi:MAG TPA: nicotinate-nucleotide adenylyltransferase [Firmicutes bacterium]|nr:nicotinate-nucleotide adenylyltransferase [Bacillota bacterium]
MGKRIVIFGGTFNPVHNGHIHLAQAYQQKFQFDMVLVMPTNHPPHKTCNDLASNADRLAMCQIAFGDLPHFEVSDYEFHLSGKSYTVHTLEALEQIYTDATFYFIMGGDMLLSFDHWYRWKDILQKAHLLAAPRTPQELPKLREKADFLNRCGGHVILLDIPVLEISSTQVRQRVGGGEDISDLVPAGVQEYIRSHQLYRDTVVEPETLPTREELLPLLQAHLKPDRYQHTLQVAAQSVLLAKQYGADPHKAETAGLLHDIMKNEDPKKQLHFIEQNGIILNNVEKKAPQLWHAIAGAVFAEKELGIRDPDVLCAIRYHTTGRSGMSILEKIVFMADLTSQDRHYPDVGRYRVLVLADLDMALLHALSYTLGMLLQKGTPLHPDTLAAYWELSGKIKNR